MRRHTGTAAQHQHQHTTSPGLTPTATYQQAHQPHAPYTRAAAAAARYFVAFHHHHATVRAKFT